MSNGAAEWFYAIGNEQKGPVPVDQLRALVASGAVGRDTLVWTRSMSEWLPLSRTELASLLSQPPALGAPPPLSGGYAPQPGYAPPGGYVAPAGYGQFAVPPGRRVTGFGEAIAVCFSKYASWKGRASRPEHWWFYLFYMLVLIAGSVLDTAFIGSGGTTFAPLSTIAVLALALPMLAVAIRRLHDTDRSGWWYWIILVPLAGPIILIVFLCQQGTPAPNRFG